MPDDDRDFGIDTDEEFSWDCDLCAPGESETFDLLDEGENDDE